MDSRPNGASAIVEFDYKANEPDELSISKGQTIVDIKVQPGGWWHGTVSTTGKSGMFPDNFVKLIDQNNDDKVILRDKSSVRNRHCKVIYSYKESKDDELTLAVGDVIEVFEEVEDGWWRGKLGSKIGVFPSNFVELIESISPITSSRKSTTVIQNKLNNNNNNNRLSLTSSKEDLGNGDHGPTLPPKPIRELCKVIYAYNPVNEDELKLVEGDTVTVLSKDLPDKGWWKGELKGKVGVFPDNFVTLLPSEPTPVKERPERPPIGTKTIITTNSSSTIMKSPNLSTNRHSIRKESFGSKDSLTDNTLNHHQVASERNSGIFGNVAAQRRSLESKSFEGSIEKPPRKSLIITDASKTPAEIRKSLENLDEKKSTPPPVLTKKPILPVKKSPSVTSVAGNIFSGLKQRVKSVESKLHSVQSDGTDGSGASRIQIADNNEKGVVIERIRKDGENEFDHVERGGTVLMDVRQNRARAPKRRPPTAGTGLVGDSNNNVNMNGSHTDLSSESIEPESPKEKEDVELAKPKPRGWEKHKAPWMEELKASQAKKTSPSIEKTSPEEEKIDLSKSFSSSYITRKSDSSFDSRTASLEIKSSSFDAFKKDPPTTIIDTNSKSTTKISITDNSSSVLTTTTTKVEENNVRPTSVNLRNRSISPIARASLNHVPKPSITATHISPSTNSSSTAAVVVDSTSKVSELEQRIHKLENLVSSQNQMISELKDMLKDESEKVRSLRSDLEKYAQCFTQDKKPTSKIFVNNFKH